MQWQHKRYNFFMKGQVYLMRSRFSNLRKKNECGLKLLGLRTDQAGEHTSKGMTEFGRESRITLEHVPTYAIQSNGASERLSPKLWTNSRRLLLKSKLDLK